MAVANNDIHVSPSAALRWLEEHGDALYAYALARVRNPSAAEDLVQEALLAALNSADDFLRQSSERTWLIGILKHKLIDHLRRHLRERPLSDLADDGLVDLFDRSGRWKKPPCAWSGDPRELAERAEFRDVLARCLSRLPSRMAQLFWLREAEGMETRQLCDQLDVSPANVWTLLHRAPLGAAAMPDRSLVPGAGSMKWWRAIKLVLFLHCRDAAPLISLGMDRKLSGGDRVAVASHLIGCNHCRRYRRQLLILRQILCVLAAASPAETHLSHEARARLKTSLRDERA